MTEDDGACEDESAIRNGPDAPGAERVPARAPLKRARVDTHEEDWERAYGRQLQAAVKVQSIGQRRAYRLKLQHAEGHAGNQSGGEACSRAERHRGDVFAEQSVDRIDCEEGRWKPEVEHHWYTPVHV
eukprot:scaffold23137_cov66-Phaeocystis_antarctica.AAC.9